MHLACARVKLQGAWPARGGAWCKRCTPRRTPEERCLVVGIQQRQNDVGEGLVGAGGDHDVVLRGAQPPVGAVVGRGAGRRTRRQAQPARQPGPATLPARSTSRARHAPTRHLLAATALVCPRRAHPLQAVFLPYLAAQRLSQRRQALVGSVLGDGRVSSHRGGSRKRLWRRRPVHDALCQR